MIRLRHDSGAGVCGGRSAREASLPSSLTRSRRTAYPR